MKKLLIIALLLISNATILCQNTKTDSTTVSNRALDFMQKDLTACDSLKKRYNEQLENSLQFAKRNMLLVNERDSINNENNKVNLRLDVVQKQLDKTTQKKGISVFEGILIGVGAFGLGALIF